MSIENMKNDDENTDKKYATALERQNDIMEQLLESNLDQKERNPTRTDQLKTASLNTALHCHKDSENIGIQEIIRDADEIYAWLIGV